MDTDDLHAHAIANRVGPDGRANDLWHERIIRERVCAEIAAERGWDIVVGRHNRDIVQRVGQLHELPSERERRLSDGDYRRLHETGEVPWQVAARPYVLDAVDRAQDWADLHRRLKEHGVIVKLVRRGERIQGLAFAEGDGAGSPGCAASRIADRCKLGTLEARFGSFRAPDEQPVQKRDGNDDRQSGIPWHEQVRDKVLMAVDSARSWEELTKALAAHGIVVKLVERGGRVQGLAFAQGHGADAPGCGASRIDDRCKKLALEARFGPFQRTAPPWQVRDPRDEPGRHTAPEQARPPTRDRTAGNACKSGAQHDANKERKKHHSGPGTQRARVARDSVRDPEWALRRAQGIAEHAKVRADYRAYREDFYAKNLASSARRREDAWQRERAQRSREAQRRREARHLLRAVARVTMRSIVRQAAYWTIEFASDRRRAQEWASARARWEATKIVLTAQRRVEHPMAYREFVVARAAAGDPAAARTLSNVFGVKANTRPSGSLNSHVGAEASAARVADSGRSARQSAPKWEKALDSRAASHSKSAEIGDREKPQQSESASVSARKPSDGKMFPRVMSLSEIRIELARIGEDASKLYEEVSARRERRAIVARPPKLDDVLAAERAELRTKVERETNFTDTERKQFTQLRAQQRSWNPITRSVARAQERQMVEAREQRLDAALRVAQGRFESSDVPSIQRGLGELERRYQAYVRACCDDQEQMRHARRALRESLPMITHRLEVLERAGVTTIESVLASNDVAGIGRAVEVAHQQLPPTTRTEVESVLRQEQRRSRGRTLDRSGP